MSNSGGFGKFTGGGGQNFVNISGGKLVVRCKDGDPDAVPRKLTKGKNVGKTIYEQHYDFFTGKIKHVGIVKSPLLPDSLNIYVTNEKTNHTVILTMQYDSDNATKFYKVMKNIDLSEPVTFRGYNYQPDGTPKPFIGYNVFQNDVKLESYWDKKEIPQWTSDMQNVPGKVEKQKVWDKTPATEFFLKHLEKWIKQNKMEIPERKEKSGDDDEEGGSGFGNASKGTRKAATPDFDAMDDDEIPF